jgi:hypothetical protein
VANRLIVSNRPRPSCLPQSTALDQLSYWVPLGPLNKGAVAVESSCEKWPVATITADTTNEVGLLLHLTTASVDLLGPDFLADIVSAVGARHGD